jgi:hypothetical protein
MSWSIKFNASRFAYYLRAGIRRSLPGLSNYESYGDFSLTWSFPHFQNQVNFSRVHHNLFNRYLFHVSNLFLHYKIGKILSMIQIGQ